ncbi:glycosyl hydrolase 108 family protein [Carnimonas bestiolae]|uniref:glycosyl hydrolase 108 family protein n=1 Tax=Carnimonas bestiolae TaxID=3402172 RepID=UPI003EDBF36B
MTIKSKAASGAGVVAIIGSVLFGVFGNEGGEVDDPNDPGGHTKYGITERVATANGFSIADLTQGDAAKIYYNDYISAPGYTPLVELSPAVGHKIVDAGVNVGPARESRWLQRALNAMSRGGRDYPMIAEDGIAGSGTARAFESLVNRRGESTACELIIKLLDAQQAVHYMSINGVRDYGVGWVDNRIGNVPLSWCSHYPVMQ